MFSTEKKSYIVMAFIVLESGEMCMRYTFHAGASGDDVAEEVKPLFQEKYPMAKIIMQALRFRTEDLDWAAQVVAECGAQEDELSDYGILGAEYLDIVC